MTPSPPASASSFGRGVGVSLAGRDLGVGGIAEINFVPSPNFRIVDVPVPGKRRVDLVFTAPLQLVFTNQATVAIGAWLRPYQSPTGTATLGPALPAACTLVEVIAWKANTTGAATFDIQAGSTLMYQHTIAAGSETGTATGLGVDFAAGSVVNVKISAALTNGGGIILMFRRKG